MNKLLYRQLLLERELAARQCKKSLSTFTKMMWPMIEPKTEYHHNWHIDAMGEFLEAVSRFEIKKGIIMVPPRHMKSIMVSVMWPAWEWIERAHSRFIFTSYAQSVSMQDSIKCRTVLESERYQQYFFPTWKLLDDQNTKARYKNTEMGERIATSVDGISTSLGGDFIVGDDLISAKDCYSEVARKEANDYWLKVMSTRGNNPDKHAHLLIMQRLHEKDPAGAWIDELPGDIDVLKLPARYEPKLISIPPEGAKGQRVKKYWPDKRTKPGELLWPTHMTEEALAALSKTLGPMQADAQLQQDPKPADGGTFKREWWKRFSERPKDYIRIFQFWDCAESKNEGSDYSVGATWMETYTGFYLLDLWRNKVEAPELEQAVKDYYAKWAKYGCSEIVIEKKSNGTAVLQNLLATTTLPVFAFVPTVDKLVRASAATPTVAAGNCYLPEGADWVEDFISEHEKFPLAEHDDQVDTTSMMREYFVTRAISEPRIRTL